MHRNHSRGGLRPVVFSPAVATSGFPARAALALALAMAYSATAMASDTGVAAGGTGTSAGESGAQGAGAGGSAGINGPSAGVGPDAGAAGTSPGANGGDATTDFGAASGGAGGGGGANGATALRASAISGGNGGHGSSTRGSGGGGGGGGGIGALLLNAQGTMSVVATIHGGNGGAGAEIGQASASFGGGGGGGGGDALYLTSSTAGTSLTIDADVRGGDGGLGGNSASGGDNTVSGAGGGSSGTGGASVAGAGGSGGGGGGGGGGGLYVSSNSGTTLAIVNHASITGGNGGNGGSTFGFPNGNGGNAGQGGIGVNLSGAGTTLTNTGSIAGGNGGSGGASYGLNGAAGAGGAGVTASGGVIIINSGSIAGGLYGSGARAHAVDLSGGANRLVLEAGSVITGNVVSLSGISNGGDSLVLGGDANAAGGNVFSASSLGVQYQGFSRFVKTGASTWTLTGSSSVATVPWTIDQGVLAISSGSSLGTSALTIDGGTLEATRSLSLAQSVAVGAGGATLLADDGAVVTLGGDVTGTGRVVATGVGTLATTGTIAATGGLVVQGTLQVGTGGTRGRIAGDVVDNGAVVFNRSDAVSYDDVISGTGSLVQQGPGTLVLNGANNYTGATSVAAGTLQVGDATHAGASIASDVAVQAAATLGGHGTINGAVSLSAGAHLAPGGSIGALTINGDLTAASGSILDFEFGAPGTTFQAAGTSDRVNVAGDLALGGATLNVVNAGGFGPGLYNLFTYGGTLTETNGGIALGTVPAGSTLTLQALAGSKQINLIDTTGLTLGYWNANGLASASQAGGGSGTWSTVSPNWTDATGNASAAMQPQPGFAIFSGDAGVVSVDGSHGAVTATGMQFASDGYALTGDTLTLVGSGGASPVIRVGNGAATGQADVATIDNVIAGSDGLVKSDLGTLVLGGSNLYTGGTTIDAGTLQLGHGGTTGSIRGPVVDNGTLAFDRSDDVVFDGTISGQGSVIKRGAGTLVLNGANRYSGSTTVATGTLEVGDAGHAGATILGNVSVGADGTLRGHGSIGGDVVSDGVVWPGASVGTLTINGNYTQRSDGALVVDVTPTNASQLVVNGTATLGGSLHIVFAPGTYDTGTVAVLKAASVRGQFADVSYSGALPAGEAVTYGTGQVNLEIASASVAPLDASLFGNFMRAQNLATQQVLDTVLDVGTRSDGCDRQAGGTARVASSCRSGAWAQYSGGAMSLSGSQGLNSSVFGVLAGYDVAAGDVVHVGIEGGYNRINGSDRQGGNGHIDSVHGGVYAFADAGPLAISATLGQTHSRYQVQRQSGAGLESARPGGSTTAAGVQVAWPVQAGRWVVAPALGALYQHQRLDGFSESTGSDSPLAQAFLLQGSRSHFDMLQPFAKLQLTHAFDVGGVSYSAAWDLGYRYAVRHDDTPSVSLVTEDGSLFAVPGRAIGKGMTTVGARVSAQVGTAWRFFAAYQGQFASHADNQALSVGLTRAF